MFFRSILVSLLIISIHHQQFVFKIDQFHLYIFMSLCSRQLNSLSPQQLISLTKDLIESTTKGIDIYFSTERWCGGNFRCFVICSPTIIVNLRVVSETNLSDAKINQIGTFLILWIHKDNITRFDISMNNPNSLSLFLSFITTSITSQYFIMQIMQNLCTSLYKINNLFLFPRFFN